MTRNKRHINHDSGITFGKDDWRGYDDDQFNVEDSNLLETISDYMKGKFDLEEVRNDLSLMEIDNEVKKMISDYHANKSKYADHEKFIRESFVKVEQEKRTSKEIRDIKLEIHSSDVNELTAEWVKDWQEKKKQDAGKISKSKEIQNFITSSLESEKDVPDITLNKKEVLVIRRSPLLRYISLTAAAVIGSLILIRILLPSSDPEELYKSYYKPYITIPSVTRNVTEFSPDKFSASVESYSLGDYLTASAGFSEVFLNDTSLIAPRFFMGITQLAIGKYDQAISLLRGIAGRTGEYNKDIMWYLGLAYLKTGEKKKASACFSLLTETYGFYSVQSGELLRRLKINNHRN